MDQFQSTVLGIVQGLTEFLPISSSGHLVLFPFFFKWEDPGLAFDVALHMGTLVAVLSFFWKDWVELLKQLTGKAFSQNSETPHLKHIVIGTLPAMAAGLAFQKQAEEVFRSPLLIAGTLSSFGLLLWYWDQRGNKNRSSGQLSAKDALLIGAAQALALIPGVSRSGITITAALALGLNRSSAVRFSFLLSAPIVGGAGILKAKSILAAIAAGGPMATAIGLGFVSSLISGLLAIWLLSYMVKAGSFKGFAAYRLALSLVIIVAVILR